MEKRERDREKQQLLPDVAFPKMQNLNPSSPTTKEFSRTTIFFILLPASLFSLLFIVSLSHSQSTLRSRQPRPDPFLFPNRHHLKTNPSPSPPSLAYFISGSAGDFSRILRLLYATYHPKNRYLLHLDGFAPQSYREALSLRVQSDPIFRAAQNVDVLGKPDFSYAKGSSPVSATLHGASVLLRLAPNWDWFVSLNARDDYPLVTQDDLLHILSYLPKDLNFVNHSSYIGWRELKQLKPIIVDPGLYLRERTEMFYASQTRDLPNAYQMFTGSSFTILSRNFIEYCILGTDNLPRTLLMYLSNTVSSISNYFQTVLCNSPQFKSTTINNNLHYSVFDPPPKSKPRSLNSSDYDDMLNSGAAFASRFGSDDSLLDRIDEEILRRSPDRPVPGGWCLGEPNTNDTCSLWGDADVLRPGLGASRLEKLIVKVLSDDWYLSHQCILE